jgi:VIT1/CCC1 family predicted Fe2+/Mn2+ transporter
MKSKVKQITKALFYVLSVLYPAAVFYFLVIRKTALRQLSLFVIAFALLAFIAGTSSGDSKKKFLPLFGRACFS